MDIQKKRDYPLIVGAVPCACPAFWATTRVSSYNLQYRDNRKKNNWFIKIVVSVALFMGCLINISATDVFAAEVSTSQVSMMAIANATHADAIPQQYIVILNTFNEIEILTLQNTIIEHGGTILGRYDVINGFAAVVTDDAMFALRTSRIVKHIEADIVVRGLEDAGSQTVQDPANWGIDRIDDLYLPLDNQYTYETDGSGVTVYVVDSGINPEHEEFEGRVVTVYDSINDGRASCGNHGTGIASVIGGKTVGVANKVMLRSMRVLDCNLSGSVSSIIEAMDWLNENAQYPAVVNMSLGSYDSEAYDAIVNQLINKGIAVVAAAGNVYQYDACNISPGGANNVITVAASDQTDEAGWFTGMGKCVELFAPGVDIYMAADQTGSYQTESGTSFATPHVTGCVARFLQNNPNANPSEIQIFLDELATQNLVSGDLLDTPNRLLHCNDLFDDETIEPSEVDETKSLSSVTISQMIGEWQLIAINGETVPIAQPITLVVNDGNFVGFGGCNDYQAIYTMDDNGMTLGNIIASGDWCDDASLTEEIYFSLVQQITRFETDGIVLTLSVDDRSASLEYVRTAASETDAVPTAVNLTGSHSAYLKLPMGLLISLLMAITIGSKRRRKGAIVAPSQW